MRTHTRMPQDFDALRMHDQDIREAITIWCHLAWQNATSYTRRKYPRFALRAEVFVEKAHVYQSRAGDSILQEAMVVLNHLVRVERLFTDATLSIPSEASNVLKAASFAGCLLGDVASPGDLQVFVRQLQREFEWEDDVLDPKKMHAEYKAGRPTHLRTYLYGLLECALGSMADLDMETRKGTLLRHAPAPWFDDPKIGFVLDLDMIQTHYHLYSSLLELIELTPGRA